jgi:hypothetical protein
VPISAEPLRESPKSLSTQRGLSFLGCKSSPKRGLPTNRSRPQLSYVDTQVQTYYAMCRERKHDSSFSMSKDMLGVTCHYWLYSELPVKKFTSFILLVGKRQHLNNKYFTATSYVWLRGTSLATCSMSRDGCRQSFDIESLQNPSPLTHEIHIP